MCGLRLPPTEAAKKTSNRQNTHSWQPRNCDVLTQTPGGVNAFSRKKRSLLCRPPVVQSSRLQPKLSFTLKSTTARKVVAGLMLGLWLGTMSLAALPALHQLLHQDSNTASHECLVTSLTKSQMAGAPAHCGLVTASVTWPDGRPVAETSSPSGNDCRLSPSRAPPAHSFFISGC